jgi:hypothetical protein
MPLWKEVLVSKYGSHILGEVEWSTTRSNRLASTWWKNIVALDKAVPGKIWFLDSINRKIGNGLATSFWNTPWIGGVPLATYFPRLYSLSNQKENMVRNFLVDNGETRTWSFSWRRNLFQWEVERVAMLKERLEREVGIDCFQRGG